MKIVIMNEHSVFIVLGASERLVWENSILMEVSLYNLEKGEF